VAGTDCSFVPLGPTTGRAGQRQVNVLIAAAAILCDASSLQILATATHVEHTRFPYVPGLLSFREAPAVIAAVGKLPRPPDLLLCDGQGIAHPRRLGLAAHVGIWGEIPTIGVAKSRLCGEFRPPGFRRGCHTRLIDRGEVVGSVVRTQDGVQPLYVSVGNLITLEECIRWTLRCANRYRLAEPNRQAHMLVGELSREIRRPV
jgi:deoxyribonuclease V